MDYTMDSSSSYNVRTKEEEDYLTGMRENAMLFSDKAKKNYSHKPLYDSLEHNPESFIKTLIDPPCDSILALLYIFQFCEETDYHLDSLLPGGSIIVQARDNSQHEKFRIALRELLTWFDKDVHKQCSNNVFEINRKLTPFLFCYKKTDETFNKVLYLDILDPCANTPVLHLAAASSNPEYLKILLSSCSGIYNINFLDASGCSPLHIAVEEQKYLNAKLLLQTYHANPNTKNKSKTTPLLDAIQNKSYEMVELLLRHLADPNVFYNPRYIPLNLAIEKDDIRFLKLLLLYDATPNIYKIKIYEQPLYFAIRVDEREVVQLLLEHDADANISECNALHHAIRFEKWDLLDTILPYIHNLNQTYQGKTAHERIQQISYLDPNKKDILLKKIQSAVAIQHSDISDLSHRFSNSRLYPPSQLPFSSRVQLLLD